MIGEYETRVEEGVTLPPYTLEVTAFLQRCFNLLESGQEDQIYTDPFFESGLTDEQINAVVEALDKEYESELVNYPGYHRNRSGANALPEFHRLSTRGRRAMIEGLLLIKQKHAVPAAGA